MPKFLPYPSRPVYHEIDQPNPIRWQILYRQSEDRTVFEKQSGKIKCRDFFNDIVAKYNGHPPGYIYGFNADNLKLNEEGMYFYLTNLQDKFESNIVNKVNTILVNDDSPPLEIQMLGDKAALLLIPRHYFSSTYQISLVTLMIRVSNYGEEVPDMLEDFIACNPARLDVFRKLEEGMKTVLLSTKTKPPLQGFWYYASEHYNSGKEKYVNQIHNNGIIGWLRAKAYAM